MLSAASSDGIPRRARGALEAAVMDVLWRARQPLSPGEVRDLLAVERRPDPSSPETGARELSYSTVVTILTRLHGKKMLARTRVGRSYQYAPLVAQLGRWSPAVIDRGDPTSTVLAIIAGVLLGIALTAVVRFTVRRGRALAEAFRHARGLPGRAQIVVTRDSAADAYTVPGRPGRIGVSAGMLG